MECQLSVTQGVDRVLIEGIDRHPTVDAISTYDSKDLWVQF